MANETSVIKIQYDTDEAVTKINDLTKAIAANEAKQAEMKQALKDGKISQKDYSTQMAETSLTLGRDSNERKKYINVVQSEIGSIKRAKTENQVLREERNKLNLQTEEGRKKLAEYNTKIDANTAIIKGNVDAQSKLYMNMGKIGDSLSKIPGPIGSVISGIGGMTKAALAFIATPIGAIVAALALALKALISYFKGSEEGQNRLNKIMAVFNVIVGNLGDLIQKVGKWVFEAVSKPKETIEKLGNLIKENLINRFKAFGEIGKAVAKIFSGEFKEGFKDLTNAGLQAVTGVTDVIGKVKNAAIAAKNSISDIIDETKKEIEIAKNLADRQAALDLLQRKHLVESSKLEAEVSKIKSEAVLKEKYSAEERIAMLRKANDMELAILDTDLKITKEKAALKAAQNDLSNSTKEDLNEQAQLEADVFNVQKENAQKRMALNSQLNSAIKEMEEENLKSKKAAADAAAKIIADEKAANEKAAEEKKKLDEEQKQRDEEAAARRGEAIFKLAELKRQEQMIEEENFAKLRDLQIEDEAAKWEFEKANIELTNEEREVLDQEHKMRLEEIEAVYQENVKAMRQAALQESYNNLQGIINATKSMADSRITILSDAFSKIATIDFKEKGAALATFEAIGQAAMQLSSSIIKNYDNEYANLASQKEAELALVGDDAAAKDAINKKYAQKELELKKKQFNEEKKKALIDAAIATALAVIKGLASGLPMPGILMAALAAVLGGVQIAAIAKQKYTPSTTYAKGGVIGGKPHSQGGTQFWGTDGSKFEAERGEALFVMKKDATAEIAALSAINESFGGRSYFDRKPTRTYAEGGEVSSQVGDIRKTVNDEISRTPIYVRVGDIQTGMTEVEKSKNVGVV
jgi:hypothetical protein